MLHDMKMTCLPGVGFDLSGVDCGMRGGTCSSWATLASTALRLPDPAVSDELDGDPELLDGDCDPLLLQAATDRSALTARPSTRPDLFLRTW
jgi:hypothetical protein